MTREQFIKQIAPLVQKYAPMYGIKACSAVIAQSVLETGGGNSELAVNANNFFGLKYRNGRCPTSNGIYYKDGSEQNADGSYTTSAMKWFKFPSMEDCVIGYFDFTKNYAGLKDVADPETYLKNIKADGYATSINYVPNLMKVINTYNLTQYDATTTTATTTVKYYRVQCGAFKNKSGATALLNKLKTAGFSPIIKQINGLYKVQLNAFKNKANAESFLLEVKSKGFNAFVTYC